MRRLQIDDTKLDIELRVGILAHLPLSRIANIPDQLNRGAVIRIELADNRKKYFHVARASFSETRYLDNIPRDVVIFPRNPLSYPDAPTNQQIKSTHYWSKKPLFTIGGLSGLDATMATYIQSSHELGAANPNQIIALMRCPHPKIASAVINDDGQVKILTGLNHRAGKLEFDQETLKIRMLPINGNYSVELLWKDVTFADEPATSVAQRIKRYWRYHDNETVYWTNDEVRKGKVDVSTGYTGPLFFGSMHQRLTLRYPDFYLQRYVFPMQDLVNFLSEPNNERAKLPVAGLAKDGGLFLEIAPGRIVETPSQRIIWRSRREEQPLRFQWEMFGTGDIVELKLVLGELFAVDRIMIVDWHPGIRSSFGEKGAWLPVRLHDTETGSLKLGYGDFQVVLPVAGDDIYQQKMMIVFLSTTNEIIVPESPTPKPADTALLTMDENNRPRLIGFEQYEMKPIFWDETIWADDPLSSYIVQRNDSKIFPNKARLRRLIDAAQGCIPVTIEQVNHPQKVIYYSRRNQLSKSKLQPGQQILCRVLGSASRNRVLVRCGSSLLVIQANNIVSGLPDISEQFERLVMEKIRIADIPIWLRVEENELKGGLIEEYGEEFFSTAILLIDDSEGSQIGLLWRSVDSKALYWMPSEEASWAELSLKQLKDIFISSSSPYETITRLQYHGEKFSPFLSIIASSNAKKEFKGFSVGHELSVRVVYPIEESNSKGARYIVASKNSGVFLECSKGQYKINDDIVVEIEQINLIYGGLVTVVPLGMREYHFDLPENILASSLLDNWIRDCFKTYLDIRRRTAAGEILHEIGVDELDEETVICAAYSQIKTPSHLCDYLPVVIQWSKRQLQVATFELPFALMAIIVLFEASQLSEKDITESLKNLHPGEVRFLKKEFKKEWGKIALNLTRLLVDRALRSLHVETLTSQWLACQENRQRKHPSIWSRLNQLPIHLQQPFSMNSIMAVSQFTLAAEMHGDKEIAPISEALKASIGSSIDPSQMKESSKIIAELINLRATIPIVDSWVKPPQLKHSHIKRLSKILEQIDTQGIDIQLLPHLPMDITQEERLC